MPLHMINYNRLVLAFARFEVVLVLSTCCVESDARVNTSLDHILAANFWVLFAHAICDFPNLFGWASNR